jgi:hypothetical protein
MWYFDIGQRAFVRASGSEQLMNQVTGRRGDSIPVSVRIQSGSTAVTLTDVTEMVFVVKSAVLDGVTLMLADTWTEDDGVWSAQLAMDTEELETAMDGLERGEFFAEFTFTSALGTITSQVLTFPVTADLWLGIEGTPLSLPTPEEWLDARAVRYDAAQTLTDPQKAQARANIGVATGTGDLVAANNLSDLANAATARTNLGLGTAATSNAGDFATAAQGTDERVPTAAGLTSKFGTNKATIANGDKFAILDSAASDAPKHSLFSLVKSTLKTYFDTLYAAISHSHVSDDITDSTSDGINNPERILLTDSNSRITLGGIELGHLTDTTITRASAGVIAVEGVSVSMAGHTHTASNITDFSSAVAATASVTANTAKVTNATHTGDATGSGALTVVRIQGVDIPAPVAGDDLKYIRYNHSTGDFDYSAPSGSGDALTSNPLSQFAATTSAQLAGVISDETGTGALVFANSPTLVNPALGTPSSGTLTNCTGLPAAGVTGLGTLATQSGTFSGTSSGTNTGDNAVNALYSGLVSNATHTGDVTGATALAIDKTAITGKTAVTAVGTDYVLISDTSDSGNLKKALVSDFGGGGSSELVPLGTVSVTSAADIKLDNIFDDALYDHYIYSLKILPATDNVSLIAKLRTSAPADAVIIRRCGGVFVQMNGTSSGTVNDSAVIRTAFGNATGSDASGFGSIVMGNGVTHLITYDFRHIQSVGDTYTFRTSGDFNDTTPRQGIKFEFSSGNVASGTLSVWGVLKQ